MSFHSAHNSGDVIVSIKLKCGIALKQDYECKILIARVVRNHDIWRGFMCKVSHPFSLSVSHNAAHFEWFSTVVKRAESDLNSPCTVKIPGLWKVKGKSNQCVNRGSVNHTFPGRLCQDQLCIHHSLHDLCVHLKEEIKDRRGKRQK